MLIIKGVNVFPSQIEEVLVAIEGCEPHYQLVVDRKGALDVLEVCIEVRENIFFDEMKKQRAFLDMVGKKIDSVLGVGVTVKVEPLPSRLSTVMAPLCASTIALAALNPRPNPPFMPRGLAT